MGASVWFVAAGLLLAPEIPRSPGGRPLVWTWETWREIAGVRGPEDLPRPAATYTRPDGLAPLLEVEIQGRRAPIRDRDGWSRKRRHLLANWNALFGRFPRERCPLRPAYGPAVGAGAFTRQVVRFSPEPGERVSAYLLVPKGRKGRLPAAVCPHSTSQDGKRQTAGLAGKESRRIGAHLAARGFVALCLDALCFGERHADGAGFYGDAIPFYERHPEWTVAGKHAWDISRAVDLLRSDPRVDPDRIACCGHSLGGHTTIFAMVLDPRIAAGFSSCGFTPFRTEVSIHRLHAYYRLNALLPRLAFYDGDHVARIPIDYHEMLALIAPRPFLVISPLHDDNFVHAGAVEAVEAVRPVYRLLGAPDAIVQRSPDCGHDFPEDARRFAYRWLEEALGIGSERGGGGARSGAAPGRRGIGVGTRGMPRTMERGETVDDGPAARSPGPAGG